MLRAALIGLTLASFSVGCGSSSSKKSDPVATTPWSDTAMQNLVASKCATAGCHDGTVAERNYINVSEATMKADTQAKTDVDANVMPQSGPLSASDKAIVDAFYAR